MAKKNICTKDPTTCAFGTLARLMPEVLSILGLQNELIATLFEFKSVKTRADHKEIYLLRTRYAAIVGKVNTWSKRHREEKKACPQHQKH